MEPGVVTPNRSNIVEAMHLRFVALSDLETFGLPEDQKLRRFVGCVEFDDVMRVASEELGWFVADQRPSNREYLQWYTAGGRQR